MPLTIGRIKKAIDNRNFQRYGHDRTTRYGLEEYFKQRTVLATTIDWGGSDTFTQAALRLYTGGNKDFVLSGTNAVNTVSALAAGGGVTLTSTTADADQCCIFPAGAINSVDQTAWAKASFSSSKSPVFRCRITTGASIAKLVIKAGLVKTNAINFTTDDDQVFFSYVSASASSPYDTAGSTSWQVNSSIAGTDAASVVSTLYPNHPYAVLAASTDYNLEIRVNAARIATFYINGVLSGQAGPLAASIDLLPQIAIQASGTAPGAKAISARYLMCSRLW